jgi:hypothetical protein
MKPMHLLRKIARGLGNARAPKGQRRTRRTLSYDVLEGRTLGCRKLGLDP